MPTLEETIKQLENFVNALNNEMPDVMLETAISGKSLIQNRIQERGQNSNEQELGVYAQLSKQLRGARGLQTGYVDLTNTGRMWANIGVINSKKGKDVFIVTIGAKSEDNVKKLRDNTIRFGEVLKVSAGEKEELELIAQNHLEILAKKYLK